MDEFQLEKFVDIDLGEDFKAAKKSLNSLKKSIEQLKSLKKDPKNMIYEYFSDLRNKINIDRETIKYKIDEHYLGLIDEVKLIEDDHIFKNNYVLVENNKVFVSVIDRAEIQLAEFKKELDIPKIDFGKWENIQFESNHQIAQIKHKITDFENELLANKRYTFESNDFDKVNLKAKITYKVFIRRDNFMEDYGSFHVLKKGFKKFSETKNASFKSDKHFFNGIGWCVSLKNQGGNNLGFYIDCKRGTTCITKEIDANIKVSLCNIRDPENNKIVEYSRSGMDSFISFKDIFENGFYDTENDSICFLISIQKKEICE